MDDAFKAWVGQAGGPASGVGDIKGAAARKAPGKTHELCKGCASAFGSTWIIRP